MAADIAVYGASYSVYTRIVRLTLEEKGLAYRLIETDIFGKDRNSMAYLQRQPFARIPAIEIDGVRLFEASAIARYVDERFKSKSLQPIDPLACARMNQIISIMDSYAFKAMVWDVWVENVRKPERGEMPDQTVIAAGLAKSLVILDTIQGLRTMGPWLLGPAVTLADLWVAPMLTLFDLAPEGRKVLDSHPHLRAWLEAFAQRPSAMRTRFPAEAMPS